MNDALALVDGYESDLLEQFSVGIGRPAEACSPVVRRR